MSNFDAQRLAAGDLDVIDTHEALEDALRRLEAGHGPVAIDTERASGYRYSDRAYLVQVFRRGSGTVLIDPIPFGSLRALSDAIRGEEWVLHAASQDLPCLRDIALEPSRIFDTELAARILGLDRVGLGAVVQEVLGIALAKAHSADDWSVRPIPPEWLAYAALDVELLIDVRDEFAARLERDGKAEWARQEFEDVRTRPLPPVRHSNSPTEPERWRSLSGINQVRTGRRLALARELWLARDEYARETDTAPGRIIPDRAIVAVARQVPTTRGELAGMAAFTGKESRTQLDRWWEAVRRGAEAEPPRLRTPAAADRVPHLKSWEHKRPEAKVRLDIARPRIAELAAAHHLPVENLLTPAILRRLAWDGTATDAATVRTELAAAGARQWQIDMTADLLAAAFVDAAQVDLFAFNNAQ